MLIFYQPASEIFCSFNALVSPLLATSAAALEIPMVFSFGHLFPASHPSLHAPIDLLNVIMAYQLGRLWFTSPKWGRSWLVSMRVGFADLPGEQDSRLIIYDKPPRSNLRFVFTSLFTKRLQRDDKR